MAEVICLYPDCEHLSLDDHRERAKRLTIDHANTEHPGAHIVIACQHDLELVEERSREITRADGTLAVEHETEHRCRRCGNFVVASRHEEPVRAEEGSDGEREEGE